MTVIASLTTIPSRLPHLERCLTSILADPGFEKVILTIPSQTLRGKKYPEGVIQSLQSKLGNRLVIHRIPKDYGPITKLVGALDWTQDPETIIVVFDDDRELLRPISNVFSERIILNPLQAYSMGGWCFGKNYKVKLNNLLDTEVDNIMGTACIAFRRDLIVKEDLLNFRRDDVRFTKLDDMRISGYLASRGIRKIVARGNIKDYLMDLKYPGTESLSGSVRFWLDSKSVIDQLHRDGLFHVDSPGGLSIDWFIFYSFITLVVLITGVYRFLHKNKDGQIIIIVGTIMALIAIFRIRQFML
jgi:hypothetical protein